ncbi:hyalin-like [Amphiura filiformis]|uniref:hyalin-like n=1 Tax=Amphiura filiformis TaxID=82378 RepID=UPI003B225E72
MQSVDDRKCLILSFCVFILPFVEATISCPQDWSSNGGYCYYLSRQRVTFSDAKRVCETKGSVLASIHSAQEKGHILGLRTGTEQVWIGLHDKVSEGTFLWIDDTSVDYTDWPGGQPNNAGGNEDCAELRTLDGRWNDLPCTTTIGYVCKKDPVPPVISGCPSDMATSTELGTSGIPVTWTEPTATDNSNVLHTTRSHTPLEVFPIGDTIVAYIFTDSAGNTVACSFKVTVIVVDTTQPTISGCPSDIKMTTELGTNGTIVNWIEPSATDLSGRLQKTNTHVPPTFFILGKTNVVYSFVDSSNNTAFCTFVVNVITVDTVPPSVHNCPGNIDEINGRHIRWTEPTVFDISGNITEFQTHSPGILLIDTTQVGYTFTDSSSNIAHCNFTITVVYDLTPPVITCPSDIHLTTETGAPSMPVYWTEPYAFDDNGRVMLVYSSHASGDKFPIGSTTVIYVFAGDSYNTAQCNFSATITQVDTTPPKIYSCPPNMVTYVELGTLNASVSWSRPAAADISGNTSLVAQTHYPGELFATGKTVVNYTFADADDNLAYCVFSVIVNEVDTKPPTIQNCPQDIWSSSTDDLNGSAIKWIEPSAFDVSGNVTLMGRTHFPGDSFYFGSTNVIYFFTDSSNNIAICSFNVHIETTQMRSTWVEDSHGFPPIVINCPFDIVETAELGTSEMSIHWVQPTAINHLGSVTLKNATHRPGDVFYVGSTTQVSYLFGEDSDNVTKCIFSITIREVDTIPPSIDYCPDDIIQTINIGVTSTTVSWKEPTASDVCGNVTLSPKSYIPEYFSPLRDTFVGYIFEDSSGNKAFCQFFVSFEIVDTIQPIVTNCPADIYTSVELGTAYVAVSWNYPLVMDNSGFVTSRSSHESGHRFPIGSTNVTYFFEDDSHNGVDCNFTVNVESVDTTPPQITLCPKDISEDIELGDTETRIRWSDPVVYDISGNVTLVTQNHLPGDNFTVGKTEVTYVYEDGSKNQAACVFHVTLNTVDTKPPQILGCPSDVFASVELGSFVATIISWKEPKANDESGNVTLLIQTHVPGTQFGIGTTTVTYLFADTSKNMATCKFDVDVESVDTIPPTIFNCPTGISKTSEIGTSRVVVLWSVPFATDYSGTITTYSSHNPGDVFPVGSTNVSYQFEDVSLNKAECSFTVLIVEVDTTSPDIIACPDDFSGAIELSNSEEQVFWTEPAAFDNSGNVSLIWQNYFPGDYFSYGRTQVTYIFADGSKNKASCVFYVKLSVVDTTPPLVWNCPSDIHRTIEIGASDINVWWNEPSAFDESGRDSYSNATHKSGQLFAVGVTTVSYIFVDRSNNTAVCDFHVIVDQADTISPDIVACPDDFSGTIELGNSEEQVFWTEPAASDNSGNASLIWQNYFPGDYFSYGKTQVTYIFADGSENTASCVFYVTLSAVDTTPPLVWNCPSDIQRTIEIGTSDINVWWNEPSAFDESGRVSDSNATHKSGQLFTVGMTTVSYIFVDSSNNIAVCDFHVIVDQEDKTKPIITDCPSDIHKTVEIGTTHIAASWNEPLAIENSGKAISSHKSDELFDIGTTLVTYEFTDNSNNSATCQFFVKVTQVDTTPPLITYCPDDIITRPEAGSLGSSVTWDEPEADDLSKNTMLLIQTHLPGTFFAIGTTVVTYIFRDNASNVAKCSFSVTIVASKISNTQKPTVLKCPSSIQQYADVGKQTAVVTWSEPLAIDFPDIIKVSSTHKPNETFAIGSTPVVYTFEDDGNMIFCNFTVIVMHNDAIYNNQRAETWEYKHDNDFGISLAALLLSLLIIFSGLCLILLLVYIRTKNNADTDITNIGLSESSLQKSVTSTL